jgi:hypothetical protein
MMREEEPQQNEATMLVGAACAGGSLIRTHYAPNATAMDSLCPLFW